MNTMSRMGFLRHFSVLILFLDLLVTEVKGQKVPEGSSDQQSRQNNLEDKIVGRLNQLESDNAKLKQELVHQKAVLEARIVQLENKQADCVQSGLQKRLVMAEGVVAFYAKMNILDINYLGHGQTIIFEAVVTNIGAAYHNHTGVFIAPIDGVYAFNLDAMSNPGREEFLTIVKDGVPIQGDYPSSRGASHHVTSGKLIILQLRTGNEIWVRAQSGSDTLHGNGYTTFSGWLLSPM